MIIYTIVCLLVLFFCSAIVNFTKFKGSREHVYESVISEVVSVPFFCSFNTREGKAGNVLLVN